MERPLISILTPSWNRAYYLDRVWSGLSSQSFRNFEWILADDGSIDDTQCVAERLSLASNFPVIYIRSDRRVGKVRMDNEAVRRARGELVLWCDSDDLLLPHALASIWQSWSMIPASEKVDYVGVTALAATKNGRAINPFTCINGNRISWNDLTGLYGFNGDMVFCVRADVLKKNPFPEVDYVIPEGIVWTAIGNKLTVIIPDILKEIEYNLGNSISFSGNMSYNRGRAHALAVVTRNLKTYRQSIAQKAWRLINFIRYCAHGDISGGDMLNLWEGNSTRVAFWMAVPLAAALVLKDRLQGKVRKTHLCFQKSNSEAIITCQFLGDVVCNVPGGDK